jgi:hypothetical protein
MTGAMGLQHGDAFTLFQQMNGRRQTGDAGTDHTSTLTSPLSAARSGRLGVVFQSMFRVVPLPDSNET